MVKHATLIVASLLGAGDADECASEVTAEQRTRLRRWRPRKTKEEDSASTQRGEYERGMRRAREEQCKRDACRRAEDAPPEANDSATVHCDA